MPRKKTIEEKAMDLLIATGQAERPLFKDLQAIASHLGIFLGALTKRLGGQPNGRKGILIADNILINLHYPATTQRWTIAHELGHAILESCPRPLMEFDGHDRAKERSANAFAAALLMPAESFKKVLDSIPCECQIPAVMGRHDNSLFRSISSTSVLASPCSFLSSFFCFTHHCQKIIFAAHAFGVSLQSAQLRFHTLHKKGLL